MLMGSRPMRIPCPAQSAVQPFCPQTFISRLVVKPLGVSINESGKTSNGQARIWSYVDNICAQIRAADQPFQLRNIPMESRKPTRSQPALRMGDVAWSESGLAVSGSTTRSEL